MTTMTKVEIPILIFEFLCVHFVLSFSRHALVCVCVCLIWVFVRVVGTKSKYIKKDCRFDNFSKL